MHRLPSFVLAAVAALAGGAMLGEPPTPSVPKPVLVNFDADPAGKTPDGWTIAANSPGKVLASWVVAADAAAPSAPNVLRLTTPPDDPGEFNLCIHKRASVVDVDLSVKMRADSGKEDRGGGLIWRVKDDRNYYICRFNPLENNFRLYRVVDGRRRQLETAEFNGAGVGERHWYTIRARMVGPAITCWLDGRELLRARDDTFEAGGRTGLWSKADASSSFDDFSAVPLRPTGDAGP